MNEKGELIKRDLFKNERITIIGSGYSLNETPLELLENERVLLLNRCVYLLKSFPDYEGQSAGWNRYTFGDYYMPISDIRDIDKYKTIGFYPNEEHERRTIICQPIKEKTIYPEFKNRVMFDKTKYELEEFPIPFNYDLENGCVYWWRNVLIELAIPLAMFWGCHPIYLVGCDQSNNNHFYEKNDTKGPRNMENIRIKHKMARDIVEKEGFKIYNAGIGGELEVYERVGFREIFK